MKVQVIFNNPLAIKIFALLVCLIFVIIIAQKANRITRIIDPEGIFGIKNFYNDEDRYFFFFFHFMLRAFMMFDSAIEKILYV